MLGLSAIYSLKFNCIVRGSWLHQPVEDNLSADLVLLFIDDSHREQNISDEERGILRIKISAFDTSLYTLLFRLIFVIIKIAGKPMILDSPSPLPYEQKHDLYFCC